MGKKLVLKLSDKSLILAQEVERTAHTITVSAPIGVTQMFNPQTGEPDVVMLPMDLIFAEAKKGKDTVTLKQDHIMYEKDMEDFPPYLANYMAQTSGIAVVGNDSGIVSG